MNQLNLACVKPLHKGQCDLSLWGYRSQECTLFNKLHLLEAYFSFQLTGLICQEGQITTILGDTQQSFLVVLEMYLFCFPIQVKQCVQCSVLNRAIILVSEIKM